MKNSNAGVARLILLHPYIHKQGGSNRLWLLAFVSFFAVVFLGSLVYTRYYLACRGAASSTAGMATASSNALLPTSVMNTLLHYASKSNDTYHMTHAEMKLISDALRKCPSPCNFLVFGLTGETLLWKALNVNGRTIVIEENRYYAAYFEELHPWIEVFDVQYTTKIREMKQLLASAKEQVKSDCRPVQNLLFSECKLGLNDLPNHIYEIAWDLILIDGPRGNGPDEPGRMSPIYTAAVLARTKGSASGKTHIFLHDYYGAVERLYAEEFLCKENLVANVNGILAHFLVSRTEDSRAAQFCRNRTSGSAEHQ